jgi:sulfur-oxidizing protein SoxY
MIESIVFRLLSIALALCVLAAPAAAEDGSAWPAIRSELYAERAVAEANEFVRIVAPKRAEDPATVPVSITIAARAARRARSLVLVIDNNPAPVAATINFGDLYRKGADVGDRTVELRIRLDQMSPVRAILELDDGSLHMASQFVSGSGGCSSTSVKDIDQARIDLGKSRLKIAADRTRGESWREVHAQIRHPNFSGMQIDVKTNAYTPAHFVDRISLDAGSERIATFETGIAISEDPNIRMSFGTSSVEVVTMVASDTNGHVFKATASAHEALH